MPSALFECHHLYYLPQFRPVIIELQARGGFDIAMSMPRTINPAERTRFGAAVQALGLEQISAPSEAERIAAIQQREFDVVLVGNVGRLEQLVTQKSLVVMIYHGIGLKASYYRDYSPRIDILAVESAERLKVWQSLGIDQGLLTGMTKLDPLVTGPDRGPETLAMLGLDPARRTILYAPTFYPSSLPLALEPLAQMADTMNVIVKLHQFGWTQRRYRWQSELLKSMAPRAGFAVAPPQDYNILPYFQASSLLVTDISSALFEYLATGRPIVRTLFTARKLRHRLFPWRLRRRLDSVRAAQVDFTLDVPGPGVLAGAIATALDSPDQLQPQREAARQRFLYQTDGQASARLVDAIMAGLAGRVGGKRQ